MKFRVIVEHDPVTNAWSSVFPDLPGCTSCGDSEQEAITNAREALALWFTPHELKLSPTAKLHEVILS